jgi:hypothetical protein
MIINPYIFGGFDPDAQAFITAAGITNTTQQNAINTLVVDLKGYGIWNKMKAIYPFVGGTASTHKYNLKDPRDSDSAFRLQFFGGVTHNVNGITGNGSNGYGDTFLNGGVLNQDSITIASYSRTDSTSNANDIGCFDGTYGSGIIPRFSGVPTRFAGYVNNSAQLSIPNLSSTGFYLVKRITNQVVLQKNTVQSIFTQSSQTPKTTSFKILNRGDGVNASNRNIAFSSIGDGLTDTDAANLAITVESFQTTLGRSVNPWYNNGNLLLDDYPNAATAYSVRKLRNYYIGPCLRVRRSSDNAEQDIYFNPSGELDTTSLLSFVGAGNGFVTTWYDQSGNGKNAIQTTAANQPRIINAGVLDTLNSKPALLLDGTNDSLFTTTASFNSTLTSIISVNKQSVLWSGQYKRLVSIGHYNDGYYLGSRINTSNMLAIFNNYNFNCFGGNLLNQNLAFMYNNSTTGYLRMNGTQVNSLSTTVSSYGNEEIHIGFDKTFSANESWNGNIQEVIIYPSNQDSNKTGIESNINSYYTIY